MNTSFNASLAKQYVSKSQIARVLTESWTEENMYCPVCGFSHVSKFLTIELQLTFIVPIVKVNLSKKQKRFHWLQIADGAYATFIERICSNNNPDFFVMSYSISKMSIESMYFIPKHFLFLKQLKKESPCLPLPKEPIGQAVTFFSIKYRSKVVFRLFKMDYQSTKVQSLNK